MTVPTDYFGGNSDGAMRMEEWLDEMCKGCRHGHIEAGLRGMGCELPANAYAAPYDDIEEWSVDADPPGPMGLRCMRHAARSRGVKRPPTVGAKHPTLDLGVSS